MMKLKFRLREILAERHRQTGERLTYEKITAATGISPNTLSTLANNKVRKVGTTTIEGLCNFLECTPGELMVLE